MGPEQSTSRAYEPLCSAGRQACRARIVAMGTKQSATRARFLENNGTVSKGASNGTAANVPSTSFVGWAESFAARERPITCCSSWCPLASEDACANIEKSLLHARTSTTNGTKNRWLPDRFCGFTQDVAASMVAAVAVAASRHDVRVSGPRFCRKIGFTQASNHVGVQLGVRLGQDGPGFVAESYYSN